LPFLNFRLVEVIRKTMPRINKINAIGLYKKNDILPLEIIKAVLTLRSKNGVE
jgi:hypothetical protein